MSVEERPDPKPAEEDDVARAIVGVFLPVGLLSIFLSFIVSWIWNGFTTTALVLVVVGAGLVALNLFYNADRILKVLAHRRALVGANVIVMTLLGTAVLVLVSCFNGCAEGLTEESTLGRLGLGRLLKHNFVRENLGRRDLTRSRDHVLGEATHRVLDNLDGRLYMLFVDMRDRARKSRQNRDYGELVERMDGLLDEYQFASPDVVVYNIDAIAQPDLARKVFREAGLSADDLPAGDTVVLAYGDKRQDVPIEWDSLMESGAFAESFRGEQVLTSRILELTSERRLVYFLKGHGEKHPFELEERINYQAVNEALRRNNFGVEVLDFGTRLEVPEDCDVLVIAGPRVPLAETDAAAVDRYLERGGSLFFLADPEANQADLGLNAVLAKYGVRVLSDMLCNGWVSQKALTQVEYGTSTLIVASDYTIQPIVLPLRGRYNTRFPGVAVVEATVVEDDRVDSNELLYMSRISTAGQPMDNFAVKMAPGWQDRLQKSRPSEEAGDRFGRIPLGVASERKAAEEGGKRARVVVLGDSDFVLTINAQRVPQNLSLFVNAVQWLGQRESYIAIEPKTLEFARQRADLSKFDGEEEAVYRRAMLIVPVILIPTLVAFLGVAVWWRRRK